jgi:hypothetical protein
MDDAADPLLWDQITSAGDWVLVLNLCTGFFGLNRERHLDMQANCFTLMAF